MNLFPLSLETIDINFDEDAIFLNINNTIMMCLVIS